MDKQLYFLLCPEQCPFSAEKIKTFSCSCPGGKHEATSDDILNLQRDYKRLAGSILISIRCNRDPARVKRRNPGLYFPLPYNPHSISGILCLRAVRGPGNSHRKRPDSDQRTEGNIIAIRQFTGIFHMKNISRKPMDRNRGLHTTSRKRNFQPPDFITSLNQSRT